MERRRLRRQRPARHDGLRHAQGQPRRFPPRPSGRHGPPQGSGQKDIDGRHGSLRHLGFPPPRHRPHGPPPRRKNQGRHTAPGSLERGNHRHHHHRPRRTENPRPHPARPHGADHPGELHREIRGRQTRRMEVGIPSRQSRLAPCPGVSGPGETKPNTSPIPNPVLTENEGMPVCVQSLLAGGDYATAWSEKTAPRRRVSTLFISTANEVPAAGQIRRRRHQET